MPRFPRAALGGSVYHALYRSVARLPLFEKAGDYEAFERVLRYVEGNLLQVNLGCQAEAWRWSSLGRQHSPAAAA